jgi:hypothetical protein
MAEGLVELAQKYIALAGEIEGVRDAMKRLLMNGVEGPKENPTPARRSGMKGSQPSNKMQVAAEAERTIIEMLREQPGLRTGQIAAQMQAGSTTTIDRLKRLKGRGQIEGGGDSGWQVSAAP